MGEPDDDMLLVVTFPVADQWGTLEELRSRHDLEDGPATTSKTCWILCSASTSSASAPVAGRA
jgi:hypothetical protein